MIFNPEKQSEKINGKTLTYSEIGRMLITNKRINGGFRKKAESKFNQHSKTSNDNILSKDFKRGKLPPPQKPRDNPNNYITTSSHRNPMFGGAQTIPEFIPKHAPQPSFDLVQASDRQFVLPRDRHIQPNRRYVRNDTFNLAHSYSPERKETNKKTSTSKQMRQLLEYRFASHSCQLISPKVTQATVIIKTHK